MEEMAATVDKNARKAEAPEKTTEETKRNIEAGSTSIKEPIAAIRTIVEKIVIIEDIARQTTLPALRRKELVSKEEGYSK